MAAAAVTEDWQSWALHFFCVWLIGLIGGWLLPKPKWVDRGLKAKALLLASPPGLWFRRAALAAHATLIVREVWRNLFAPGTFRAVLRAAWHTLTTGQRFQWPQPAASAASTSTQEASLQADDAAEVEAVADNWYVGAKDLAEFKWTINEDGTPVGASGWELMMSKQWPGCTYTAWRRSLPTGKSEYKSVTISENATAEEFMDFYLDDKTRMKWDSMITDTQLLESGGDPASRCQVVRWLRTFPFAFISQREYIIARRFFRDPSDGALYAVTRGLSAHPAAPRAGGIVRMEDFHSHWRSRTVPCPHGSGRPACETTLLHFEDFRIPERLARFAVRAGMAGFVKGMIPAVERFVAARRLRSDPYAEDPASFGFCRAAPLPAAEQPEEASVQGQLPRTASTLSTLSSSCGGASESLYSGDGQSSAADDSTSDRSGSQAGSGMHRSSSMRRLGLTLMASGVAIAIARTASGGSLSASPPAGRRSSHGASGKRHGGAGSGSHHIHGHAHSHRQHQHQHRRGDLPPRPRRRHADEHTALETAALATMAAA